ncbi:MAG: LytTR family transcriptional regulator DNA-binding domain-containing protein [Bacteroidota bacterium]
MIRTLIIDDESPARQRIRDLLARQSDIELIGECKSGQEAIDSILNSKPDLIFLDIQMKDMNGFEVLESLLPEDRPITIFVTAYDQYAIQAFEYFAFDYLLKPFKDQRFMQSLQQARRLLAQQQPAAYDQQLQSLLRLLRSEPGQIEKAPKGNPQLMPIKLAGKIYFIPIEDIRYIEASGYYIEIHTSEKKHLLRESLSRILDRLPAEQFMRIHRSAIIRLSFLAEINSLGMGDVEVVMKDGKVLRVSKTYKEELMRRLGVG